MTDEQIALFRHSEIQQLLRARRLQREEEEYQTRNEDEIELDDEGYADYDRPATASDSSLEDGLLGLAQPAPPRSTPKNVPEPAKSKPKHRKSSAAKKRAKRKQSQSGRSDESGSTGSMQRPRAEGIPYDQRNKRRWEAYIEDTHPLHGSMTHRRMVRELDQDSTEVVEVDYGDE